MADVHYAELIAGIDSPLSAPPWQRRNFLFIKKALQNKITPADFRTKLELGTIATQDADSVAITGGTITGVTVTGSHVTYKCVEETLAANRTLAATEGNWFFFDPNGGSWNVSLWTPAAGSFAHIQNTGSSGRLLVKSGSTTIAILVAGESVNLMYSGSTWRKV